jgi:hypothetical protein
MKNKKEKKPEQDKADSSKNKLFYEKLLKDAVKRVKRDEKTK